MKRKLLVVSLMALAVNAYAGSVWSDNDPDFAEFKSLELPLPASWNQPIARKVSLTKPVTTPVVTASNTRSDFVPASQATLLDVSNPDYIAKRNAALQKPGAVVAHFSIE